MANAFVDGLYTISAKVFLMKTGLFKDLSNENNFHPNANVNGIFVHIEDGVSTNIVTLNFAPSKRANWATHDFPLLYIDTIEHTVVGEMTPRTFARYFCYVPSALLAMNINASSIMDVGVTVTQVSGVNVLGAFNTLAELQAEYNDQAELETFDEINAIAYVYEVGENGYYMVDYNSVTGLYEWVLKTDNYATYLSTKPYNMFTIKVQRGYANPKPITPLEDEQYRLLWAYMGSFAGLIEAIGNRVTALEEDMEVAQQDIVDIKADVVSLEERLDIVEPKVTQLEQDVLDINSLIEDILDGTEPFNKQTFTDENGKTATIEYDGEDIIIEYLGVKGEMFKNLFKVVEPASGVTFSKGMQVMYAGYIGGSGKRLGKPTVLSELAVNPNLYLGMVTQVLSNGHAILNWYGNVNDLNTSDKTLGAPVYVGDSGSWTTTKPVSPLPQIVVGLIERVHGTQGVISVRPKLGSYLGQIYDVYLNGHNFTGGETIMYNFANKRFEVYDLGGKIAEIEQDIDDLETFKEVTVPNTYETKSDATAKLAEAKQYTDDGVQEAKDYADNNFVEQTANPIKDVAYVSSTHVITFTYYDGTTESIDLPLESAIVSASYDSVTKDITFVLQSGATLVVPLDDLVSGLASETWVTTNFIPKTALKTSFSGTPLDTNVISEKLAKDTLDTKVPKTDIVDNLTTDDATKVLSAKQGKALQDTTEKLDNKKSIINSSETEYPNSKAVIDYVEPLEERVGILESKINVVGLDYKEYGIREVVGQSASEFERVTRFWGEVKFGSATGLVANVAIDGNVVANSFDYIPIFKREKVSIDATDLSSNTVSNTFVKVPKFYIKEEWTTEGGTNYHYYFMSQFKHEGYRLPLPFKKQDGSERDYAYMGAYEAYLDGNNKLRSLTGQIPKVSYSRNSFRTAARALDGLGVNSKYQITDLAEYVDLVQIPFMIEFATKHSQGVFLGATSMAYSASHTAIAEGTGVNAIVVSNATGANFVLGQTVSIGTSNSNDSVAKDRIITQIQVDTPNAGETTIMFDGVAVNIAIGNVIASRAWKTGMTDNVKVSGTHALNDGKHSIVWRGLENPFGNIWKNVDGVKISNWRGYVTENPKDYNDTASVAGVYAEPYLPLGYLNANVNNYAQELGYDANYPYAKLPISVQASSGLFFRDYYYQNSGDRTVFVGGLWSDGSVAGLFSWLLTGGLGSTYFTLGARLSYRP